MCNKRLPDECAIKGYQNVTRSMCNKRLPEVCVIKGYQKYVQLKVAR
jgi:hypothetical protein